MCVSLEVGAWLCFQPPASGQQDPRAVGCHMHWVTQQEPDWAQSRSAGQEVSAYWEWCC